MLSAWSKSSTWRRARAVRIAYDGLTGEEIVVPVSGHEAAEVYRHPFAYSSRAIKPTPSARSDTANWDPGTNTGHSDS
jgi:hypothetical protein